MEVQIAGIGARLRRLRAERGWRLEDLAERTGLSKAYLSRLESEERQPSLGALSGVARAYGVSFSSLFEPEPEAGNRAIVRAADNLVQRGRAPLYTNLSSKSWTFSMQPLRIIASAEHEEDVVYHEGEQWLYVLSGRLRLKLRDEEYVPEPGDAAHFDAEAPHRLRT